AAALAEPVAPDVAGVAAALAAAPDGCFLAVCPEAREIPSRLAPIERTKAGHFMVGSFRVCVARRLCAAFIPRTANSRHPAHSTRSLQSRTVPQTPSHETTCGDPPRFAL